MRTCCRIVPRLMTLLNRHCCTKVKQVRVELNSAVEKCLEEELYKPRKHPGVMKLRNVSVPEEMVKSIKNSLQGSSPKALLNEADKLDNYLRSRHPPPEERHITQRASKIHTKLIDKDGSIPHDVGEEQEQALRRSREVKLFNILKKQVYRWANISYDNNTCLQYLLVRAPAEYAVLSRIFDEIKGRDPAFMPRSFFDFGSGVGTGTWAVREFWKDSIYEYFCVDTSPHMHDIARLILCGGRENVEVPFKSFFQRQFLPASATLKYDIVLSAYTLFEMPSTKSRLETIQTLWNKTNDFLVIVEQGTNAGFQLVTEARDFVLNMTSESQKGYAYSPCPNDNICPRYLEHQTPCNFLMRYSTLPIGAKTEFRAELFSYVVLRKGKRPENDNQWPRLVRSPIVRKKHTVCRLCTSQGELKEIVFTQAKHGKLAYRCARSSSWGDSLPINIPNNLQTDENVIDSDVKDSSTG